MGEIVQKLPEYEPLIKSLIVDYFRNYDPRSVVEFMTQKVGFSKFSMRNKQIMGYLDMDMYHAVQNEISTTDTLAELGQLNNDSAFGGTLNTVDYLHKSGITLSLLLDDGNSDPLVYDFSVQEFLSIASMLDSILNKTLEKYISSQANQYPVLLNLKLESCTQNGTVYWYLVDTKMKNYKHCKAIKLSVS